MLLTKKTRPTISDRCLAVINVKRVFEDLNHRLDKLIDLYSVISKLVLILFIKKCIRWSSYVKLNLYLEVYKRIVDLKTLLILPI